ncbi:MAG TPA: HAD family hydrolase [Bacteroidetes bacterium]|nr:HAD family hydrolase [Bacteroidota bacterium]
MKQQAIFLDRDGVINEERGEYTYLIEDFRFNDGVFTALRMFQEAGYLLIVISNQGGIARGMYSREDVDRLHQFMEKELMAKDIRLTEIYYCPHHSDLGKCLCRKPGTLLLEKAMARFDIDPARSFFIGDHERDAEAAIKAGIKSVTIRPNQPLTEIVEQIIPGFQNSRTD